MSQMRDVNALAHVLNQTMSEAQGVRTRVKKLTDLLQQLREILGEDAIASGYAEQMNLELGKVERGLTDLLTHLRQVQSQSRDNPGQTPAGDSAPAKKRILVIDDERSVVELVERILKARGYQVDSVYDGQTAIKIVENQFYDLIMADLKMPEIGGMDVYRHIEAHNPAQARRVVFFSGDVVSPQTTAFLNRIGLPFLVKPFTVRELTTFVEKALA